MQSARHYDPLRPNRTCAGPEKFEFTHGTNSLCVYDINSLHFIHEIPVGDKPDCHATSMDDQYVYIACMDGLYCIGQDSLAVEKIIDTGAVYATNVMPDDDILLVHDLRGGVIVLKNISDMGKIQIHKRIQVIPGAQFRTEIGGKGHLLENGRYYLCAGWTSAQLLVFDRDADYRCDVFMPETQELLYSDDLVINKDKTKAYTACHRDKAPSYVAVVDLEARSVIRKIATGCGTCGLTMSNDERYVVASNDADDSITIIDTTTDSVVNTITARQGFDALGITGYIQGISAGKDDSIYVYGCSGNGALVRFTDITGHGEYEIVYQGGRYASHDPRGITRRD